ncbi:MAG: hypothetical protein QF577_10445, partial [Phycisphaerae bacterium]|nr:hypothetical protein [Phycisphaerae bacterium]
MEKRITFPDDPDFGPFYPGSVCLVTAVDSGGRADICTVGAWALVNGAPRLFGIAMCARPSGKYYWKRYTTTCIEQTGQFVINIPHAGLKEAWDVCGSVSLTRRPEADKFALAESPETVRQNKAAGRISLAMGMENGTPLEGQIENVAHF